MEKRQFIQALNLSSIDQFGLPSEAFDLIICVGSLPSRHMKRFLNDESIEKLVYLFTMEDPSLVGKTAFFSRYEVGSEEGVFALLAKSLLLHVKVPHAIKSYFDELDEGYMSAESNLGEEEIEEIEALYHEANSVLILLGDDILAHPRAENIAHLAGLFATYGKAKIHLFESEYDENALVSGEVILEDVADIRSFDGVVVYECPSLNEEEETLLLGSAQFQMAAKVKDHETIYVSLNNEFYPRTFVRDDSLKGVIALMPSATKSERYPYHVVNIVKAEQ